MSGIHNEFLHLPRFRERPEGYLNLGEVRVAAGCGHQMILKYVRGTYPSPVPLEPAATCRATVLFEKAVADEWIQWYRNENPNIDNVEVSAEHVKMAAHRVFRKWEIAKGTEDHAILTRTLFNFFMATCDSDQAAALTAPLVGLNPREVPALCMTLGDGTKWGNLMREIMDEARKVAVEKPEHAN